MRLIWPDAIEHFGNVMPTADEMKARLAKKSDAELLADGLMAWGNCHLEKPPQSFGMFMAVVNGRIGTSTPESFHRKAEEFLAKNSLTKWVDDGKIKVK